MRAVALLVMLGALAGCAKADAAGQYVGSRDENQDPEYVVTWGKDPHGASEGADVPSWNCIDGHDWAEWEAKHRAQWLKAQARRPQPDGPKKVPGEPWREGEPNRLHDVEQPQLAVGANGAAEPIA